MYKHMYALNHDEYHGITIEFDSCAEMCEDVGNCIGNHEIKVIAPLLV